MPQHLTQLGNLKEPRGEKKNQSTKYLEDKNTENPMPVSQQQKLIRTGRQSDIS